MSARNTSLDPALRRMGARNFEGHPDRSAQQRFSTARSPSGRDAGPAYPRTASPVAWKRAPGRFSRPADAGATSRPGTARAMGLRGPGEFVVGLGRGPSRRDRRRCRRPARAVRDLRLTPLWGTRLGPPSRSSEGPGEEVWRWYGAHRRVFARVGLITGLSANPQRCRGVRWYRRRDLNPHVLTDSGF